MSQIADDTLAHIVRVAKLAHRQGYGVLSTGERLAAAMVLNRADWLAEMSYTLPEAIDRLGPDWVSRLHAAERIVLDDITEGRV